MGLRTKFNLVMLVAFVIGLGLAGALSYKLARDNARREVLQEAAIMEGQAAAISHYTDHEIAPLLADQLKLRFLPQTIPFWAAQTNFRALQQQFPDYSFRDVASNPTNPGDRPTDWQSDIIDVFRHDTTLTEFVSERETPTGPILYVSRPIRITDQTCLACHSTPAAAPSSLVDLYGSSNGFGWKLNDVVGAQIVSVPMRVALDRAWNTFEIVMAGLTGVFLVTVLLLNLLLRFVIIRPVRAIAAAASEVSLGNMSAPEFPVHGNDEIASLAESFNRMRRSLANALKMLEG
jgi:HAMP domain-containing protein